MEFIFGKPKPKIDPLDQAKEWRRALAKEQRKLERDIAKTKQEENKILKECKKLAKSGEMKACKTLAKSVAQSRKTRDRMQMAIAQMNSVSLTLQSRVSMMKVAGVLDKSTELMHTMNSLIKLPELSATMREMAREMEKAGLVEEIVADAFDALDGEGLDEEADIEVEKIVAELTAEVLAPSTPAPMSTPASAMKIGGGATAAGVLAGGQGEGEGQGDDGDGDEELRAMQARLQAL